MDFGLLLLRVTVGLTMSAHGAQKLFGWFNGSGIDGTARGLEALGFHPGRRHATMAELAEFGGGLILVLGFVTPLGAAVVASVMLVAAFSTHAKQGFFLAGGGYEYNLVLGAAALSVAFIDSPGAISVDALLGLPLSGLMWGSFAVLVAVVGGALQLVQRHTVPAGEPAKA
jgi:putative oxidoreductase